MNRALIALACLTLAACDTVPTREVVQVPIAITCGEKTVEPPLKTLDGDHEDRLRDAAIYLRRLENALAVANDRIAACNGEKQLNDRMRQLDGRVKGF